MLRHLPRIEEIIYKNLFFNIATSHSRSLLYLALQRFFTDMLYVFFKYVFHCIHCSLVLNLVIVSQYYYIFSPCQSLISINHLIDLLRRTGSFLVFSIPLSNSDLAAFVLATPALTEASTLSRDPPCDFSLGTLAPARARSHLLAKEEDAKTGT